jgi:hypothetical protein
MTKAPENAKSDAENASENAAIMRGSRKKPRGRPFPKGWAGGPGRPRKSAVALDVIAGTPAAWPVPDESSRGRDALIREARTLYRRSLTLLGSAEETVAAARAGAEPPEVIKARAASLQAAASVAKQVQSFAEMLAKFDGLLHGTQVNIAVAYLQTPEWKA